MPTLASLILVTIDLSCALGAFVSADIAVDNFTNYVKNSLRYESFATVLLTDLGQIAGASLSIDDSQSDIVKIIYQSSLDIKAI